MTILSKSVLGAVAGVMALSAGVAIPSFASAQSAGYYGNNGYYGSGAYYDPCRRDSTNRATTGGLLGAALGAAIGSNAAARNARTEGALLGGAVGAVAGAKIGQSSAACRSGYAPRTSYYNGGYAPQYGYDSRYGSRYSSQYDSAYDDDDYYGDDRYSVSQRPASDGCSLAESPVYLPDGRTQKRFVRVCPDAYGNYQVVD